MSGGTAALRAEIAPGVWVATAGTEDSRSWARPADLAAASGMPPWRAREFLAGRGLLRALLNDVHRPAAGAAVAARRGGKPYLRGWPRLGISISHDGGRVAACAAVDRAVGVDLQHPRESAVGPLLRRVPSARTAGLAALPGEDAARELAWIWTAQEACVKATGAGFSGRPWAIDIPPWRCSGDWRGYRWISLRGLSQTPLSCAFAMNREEGRT
ncbi:4'-phosphopantetheinyl transferase superfamily protein [Streptomyces sp. YIM 98790]|uniref:4'-phosphopantetheinyl transferase family protein n=1 Tax=Streptomyces sp. YIM 98790 TaxID=2689077 RepID=UPI001A9ED043|nr:4'-phosphopantetheinyl transferase superfamily protein [Streptomyces sp. YIM 98790]